MYKHFFKRVIDFTIVLVALLIIWPFLAVIAIWLHFANKGAGAFFYQERPGKDEKIFKVIKFKSMTDERDADGKLLPDAQRLTKVGKFVRKTSIDELPQLINVLKGDMALIGPRPLLPEYLPYYTERERLRHAVRPGMSGWAQVNGRNNLSWEKRLEYDAYYAENLSLILDIKILFITIKNVLVSKDIVVALDAKKNIPLNIYRQNKKMVRIEELSVQHLAFRVTLLNNDSVREYLNVGEVFTIEGTEKWFENKSNSNRYDCVFIKDNTPIGMGGLVNISGEKAELYMYLNPEEQGKGYGYQSLIELCNYGFSSLGLSHIYLYTFSDNIRANRLYEKGGFVRDEGYNQVKEHNGRLLGRNLYFLNKK